ncbi:MAG: DUF4892 domain-containing protein [Pseudomonadota bacterium]
MDLLRRGLMVGVALCAWGSAAAPSDVQEMLPRYPRAELAAFTDTREISQHEVILGALKNNAGNIRAEASIFVTGRRIASTWYVPDEERTEVVAAYYRDRFARLGDIQFDCRGRDCGPSNHWANRVFGRAILFGPEQYQHYFLTRIDAGVATYYVATYVALRGTRKLYVHVDVVVAENASLPTGANIVAALKDTGWFGIEAGDESRLVPAVVDAMKLEPLYRLAVVGHARKQRGETVDQAISRSAANARRFVEQLVEQGVNSTRVMSQGAGPLLPRDRDRVDRIEIVLIQND